MCIINETRDRGLKRSKSPRRGDWFESRLITKPQLKTLKILTLL